MNAMGMPIAVVTSASLMSSASISGSPMPDSFTALKASINPFVWWLSAQVRREREACCDAVAADVCGSKIQYAETLLQWARSTGQPGGTALMQMLDGGAPEGVGDRIRRLVQPDYRLNLHLPLRSLVGVFSLSLLILMGIGAGTHAAVSAVSEVYLPKPLGESTAFKEDSILNKYDAESTGLKLDSVLYRVNGEPLSEQALTIKLWEELPGGSAMRKEHELTTDKDGRFSFRLREGSEKVRMYARVDGEGYILTKRIEEPFDGFPEEFTLTRGGSLSGIVVDGESGESLAGADISIKHHDVNLAGSRTEADETGRFEFFELMAGEYVLSGYSDTHLSVVKQVELAAGSRINDLELRALRGAVVQGEIFGPDGQTPLPNVLVAIDGQREIEGGNIMTISRSDSHTTDAGGTFVFNRVSHGARTITLTAEGYDEVKHSLEVSVGNKVSPLSLTMDKRLHSSRVSGAVRDAETGEPVVGAKMMLVPFTSVGKPMLLRNVNMGYRPHSFSTLNRQASAHALTDEKGRYTLSGAVSGECMVLVWRDGEPIRYKDGLVFEDKLEDLEVDFLISNPPKGFLSGILRDSEGKPIVDTPIRLNFYTPDDVEMKNALHQDYSSTNSSGRYFWRISHSGKMKVVCMANKTMSAEFLLDLDTVDVGNFDIKLKDLLDGKAISIAGRVTLPDGDEPAQGVFVYPYQLGAAPGIEASEDIIRGKHYYYMHDWVVQADEDGRYLIKNLPEGNYGVIATPKHSSRFIHSPKLPGTSTVQASHMIDIKAGQTGTINVSLGLGGVIDFTVTDAETGEKVIAYIGEQLFPLDKQKKPGYEGLYQGAATSNAHMPHLLPGTYSLSANSKSKNYEYGRMYDVELKPGEVKKVHFELEKIKTVEFTGRVLLDDGSPATRALIYTGNSTGPERIAKTDDDGKFRVEKYTVKDYSPQFIIINQKGYSPKRATLPGLNVGESYHREFQLERAGPIKGRVLDKDGGGLAGAQVVLAWDMMVSTRRNPAELTSAHTNEEAPTIRTTLSNDEGYFEFEHPFDAEIHLFAVHNGEMTGMHEDVFGESEEFLLQEGMEPVIRDPYAKALKKIQDIKRRNEVRLDLSDLQLEAVPPEIWELTSLKRLDLAGNKLKEIPPEIQNLTNLESLDLHGTQLTSLPPELFKLSKLRYLRLSQNKISELPPAVGSLTELEYLSLAGNQFKTLPPEIGNLTKLKTFYPNNNPLENPPIDVARKGIEAIREYFEEPKE